MTYKIYQHTSIISKHSYIGFTSRSIGDRLVEHIRDSDNGSSLTFHNAIRKYGADGFYTRLLDEVSDEASAKKLEIFYIKFYNTYHNGYNMTTGGDGGDTISKHPNKKLIGKRISRGLRNMSQESKIKMNLGKINYGEQNGMFGVHRFGKDNPMFGKKHTKETKELLSKIAIDICSSEGWVSPLKGVSKTQKQKDAISKANQKTHTFIYRDEIITITNLTKYCIKNKLSYGCMVHVNNGRNKSHKGYTKPNESL